MLTIRSAQCKALFLPQVSADLPRLLDYVERFYPEQAQAIGNDHLERYVRDALEQGLDHGLRKTRDLRRFLDVVMLCGPDWSAPQHAWMLDVLDDPNIPSPSLRLQTLRYELMDRLESSRQ